MKYILVITLLASGLVFGGNPDLGIKSAILPGMGQLSAGSGEFLNKNTLKGLGIMAGFTVCLHNTIRFISLKESYAEQTQTYDTKNDQVEFYDERQAIKTKWGEAYDNYQNAQLWSYVFLGLTAAVYGYGIVDALLFTGKKEMQNGSAGQSSLSKTGLSLYMKDSHKGLQVYHSF